MTGFTAADVPDQRGKCVLVTGALKAQRNSSGKAAPRGLVQTCASSPRTPDVKHSGSDAAPAGNRVSIAPAARASTE